MLLFCEARLGQSLEEPVHCFPGRVELRVEIARCISKHFGELNKVALDISLFNKAGDDMVSSKEALVMEPWPQNCGKDN